MNHIRQLDHRLQVGSGVLHLDTLHTVQAQRQVVGRLAIRLQQAHLYVDVGGHLRGYREGPGGILRADGNPFAADDAAGVHQLHQRLGAGRRGDEHGGLLTHLVGGFIGGEGDHGEGLGIPSVGAAAVLGPVHGEGGTAHVTGGEVLGQDDVSAPGGIVYLEGEGGILRTHGENATLHFLYGAAVHVGVQAAAGVVPPPVPAGLVHGVFHLVALHALAGGIYHCQFEVMCLVGFQILAVRDAYAHIGAVRGVGDGFGGETLISAGLFYGSDHEGLQHAGGVLGGRQRYLGGDVAAGVQPALEEFLLIGTEGGRRCKEVIFLESCEGGARRFLQRNLGAHGQVPGHAAAQPGCADGNADGLSGFHQGRVLGVHLQAVGLHGLDVQDLVEAAAAHFQVGVPVAGGVIGLGGDVEAEEAVGALSGVFSVERARRGVDFQRRGMGRWQTLSLFRHDGRHVQGVAGAPHAALAVDVGLDALLEHLAAYVEAAGGTLVAVSYLEVGGAAAGLGHHGEGLADDIQGCQAVGVGLAAADFLQLVVVHFHLGAAHGLGRDEVGGRYPQLLAAGIIGHQAQVAGQQLDSREAGRIHIVGRLGGVVGLLPIVQFPVIEVLPVVIVGDIPFGFIGRSGLAVGFVQGLHHLLAAVQALVQAEVDADAVDGPGLLLEQAAQVYAVRVPLVQVLGGVQGDVAAVHQAAAAAQAAVAVEVVVLQEHQDVLLINLDHTHFHGAQVHGAEGEDEVLLVGQDVTREGEFHRRFLLLLLEHFHVILAQGGSIVILQALVQGEREVSFPAFEVHLDQIALHLHITAGRALEFHHALDRGIDRNVGQFHFNGAFGYVCLHHAEGKSVVGLLLNGCFWFRFAFDGDAEVKSVRCTGNQFAQGKLHLVNQPFLQGSFLRDETHRLGAVPFHIAFHGGLENEQVFGGHFRDVFREIHADGRITGNDTARIGLDVRCIVPCRRFLNLLLGPAGHHGCQCSQLDHGVKESVFHNYLIL